MHCRNEGFEVWFEIRAKQIWDLQKTLAIWFQIWVKNLHTFVIVTGCYSGLPITTHGTERARARVTEFPILSVYWSLPESYAIRWYGWRRISFVSISSVAADATYAIWLANIAVVSTNGSLARFPITLTADRANVSDCRQMRYQNPELTDYPSNIIIVVVIIIIIIFV